MEETTFGSKRATVSYVLQKEELSCVFDRAYTRHAGKSRLIIQSVLMAVVGGISLVDFIAIKPHRGMSLFIAVAALVVGIAQWLVMPLFRWSAVRRQLKDGTGIHLTVYEKGLGFGEGARQMIIPFDKCRLYEEPGLLIVQVHQEFVGIPDRVLDEDDRLVLRESIPAAGSSDKDK